MRVARSRDKGGENRGGQSTQADVLERRRRARWSSRGSRQARARMRETARGSALGAVQWAGILAILAIAAGLIALIWMVMTSVMADETADIRARTEQQARSIAGVTARDIYKELLSVDQSLAILQEMWKQADGKLDLQAMRKQSLALTAAADDIFVADQNGIIVLGTIPASVGQRFGSAYASYPNGSLELFESDGTRAGSGHTSAASLQGAPIEGRQFLMYVLRPLEAPRGYMVGASFRSEEITRLLAAANLGRAGMVALIDLKRGAVQALAGGDTRGAILDIAQSELAQTMRKTESGAWYGATPTDKIERVNAWQRVQGRPMAVVVGLNLDSASEALVGLVTWSYSLSVLGTLVVVAIAVLLIWSIARASAARRRERARELAEAELLSVRRELETVASQVRFNAIEATALTGSQTDGVARVDAQLHLTQWNDNFVALSGVPLDDAARGMPVEEFLRTQARTGVFGAGPEADHGLAARIAVFHAGVPAVVPMPHMGPDGEPVTMAIRPVAGGDILVIFAVRPYAVPSGEDESAETESV